MARANSVVTEPIKACHDTRIIHAVDVRATGIHTCHQYRRSQTLLLHLVIKEHRQVWWELTNHAFFVETVKVNTTWTKY